MSLPGAVSLSSRLLPVSAHRPHPTHCVLSSALQKPPDSRALPRGISASLCVRGPEEQLRQVLMRVGVSVPSPKCSHCQPSKPRGENIKHRLLPFHLTPTLTFLFKTALRNALRVAWSSEQPWPTQHPLNSRRTLPCRGLLFPPTASPQSATGSSPGRLSAEPGRWQSPCPGTQAPGV